MNWLGRGSTARLAKASGYFYFRFSAAAGCLDWTVDVATVSSHPVEEWIAEFHKLRQLNADNRPARIEAAESEHPHFWKYPAYTTPDMP